MSAAIVHFAVGAGSMYIAITALYRLYNIDLLPHRNVLAFIAGVWALVPDIHHVIPHEELASTIFAIHNHPISDIFFLHYTLDRTVFREAHPEMIGVGVFFLGISIITVYVYGVRHKEKENKPDFFR